MTVADAPPAPERGADMSKDGDFLIEYFKDCQSEMRWRRENEFRQLNLLIALYPIILTAMTAVSGFVSDRLLYLASTTAVALLLLALTAFVAFKISEEHKIYEVVGGVVVRIWTYYQLFEGGAYIPKEAILDQKSTEYGTGKGYLRTLWILWALTFTVALTIGAMGYLKYIN